MEWQIVVIVWVALIILIMLFFQNATMKGKEYEEEYLKVKKTEETTPFEYRKHLNEYIVRVFDKNNIQDFYSLGNVKYTSKILNIVGFECTTQVAKLLEDHHNVISIHESTDGDFCLDDFIEGSNEHVGHA